MALARKTPSIGATGTYTVSSPFSIDSTVIWTCTAIRSFQELANANIDPYTTYYEPNGISVDDYNLHQKNGVYIITLRSNLGVFLYIPDAYITTMPSGDSVEYGEMVLAINMGALPTYLKYDDLITAVTYEVNSRIGVTAGVEVMAGPIRSGTISFAEHAALEAARKATIAATESLPAENKRLQSEVDSLTQRLSDLEQVLIDNNLIQ